MLQTPESARSDVTEVSPVSVCFFRWPRCRVRFCVGSDAGSISYIRTAGCEVWLRFVFFDVRAMTGASGKVRSGLDEPPRAPFPVNMHDVSDSAGELARSIPLRLEQLDMGRMPWS